MVFPCPSGERIKTRILRAAHTLAVIFHHNENIIFLASIDCKLFLADANWFGRDAHPNVRPPPVPTHDFYFQRNSYYILVRTIDKIISFPSSPLAPIRIYMPLLETMFLCADRYNEYEPWTFFSAQSHPTAAPPMWVRENERFKENLYNSLSPFPRVFISVEFGNSIEKVLIFVADFGSTLFPFGFILF